MQDETRERALEQDFALFQRLKQDPAVVGELYDRFADKLYSFLLKRCGHKETAEDLVSHTFMRLLESLPTLEWKNAPLSAWLYQVASNALIDHYRKASTRRDTDLDTDEWDPPGEDDPAWNVELKIESESLRLALQRLSPRDQQVLDLRFFAGLETSEVADQLGITANHAAVLVYRALGRLRQILELNEKI